MNATRYDEFAMLTRRRLGYWPFPPLGYIIRARFELVNSFLQIKGSKAALFQT